MQMGLYAGNHRSVTVALHLMSLRLHILIIITEVADVEFCPNFFIR